MADHSILVRVPATTANLGPGFDCLGMALNLWNELMVETSDHLTINIVREGEASISRNESNIIYQAMEKIYSNQGARVPGLKLHCLNKIPLKRGLGSSAAAIVGGMLAANHLLGCPMTKDDLLQEAAAIEGHADNVAPAFFGGCQIVFKGNGRFLHCQIPLAARLKAVLYIPEWEISTQKARAILSPMLKRQDAIFNLSRVALLATALTTGNLNCLKWATQDRLHQPARQALFPTMKELFQAAFSAGAIATFLSGSGSTILALSEQRSEKVGSAMLEAGKQAGIKGRIIITTPTSRGAYIIKNP